MSVELLGLQRVIRAMGEMQLEDGRKVDKALAFFATTVFKESQRLVPVDTGALKASGFIEEEGRGLFATYFVVYSMFYGIYVHENLENYHAPPTQAKFLEDPIRDNKARFERAFRDIMTGGINVTENTEVV